MPVIRATGGFTGTFRFTRSRPLAFMQGSTHRADDFGTNWTDTGIVVPSAFRRLSDVPFAASTAGGHEYRYRIQPTTGALEIQRTGVITTSMAADTFYFVDPPAAIALTS